MLRAVSLGLSILAAGCAEEPDFDTRYDEAEQAIAERADAIDAELAEERQGETGPPRGAETGPKE